ncbi:Hypothetical predicted protein [Marmota monax]|uniref:Uncharacterized protein n=1 Tax=Marmota monax TaxID=9995 RepID=A0A5E4BPL1_MARMO|nr:Hypothetical predicted protein [Marmota monax]
MKWHTLMMPNQVDLQAVVYLMQETEWLRSHLTAMAMETYGMFPRPQVDLQAVVYLMQETEWLRSHLTAMAMETYGMFPRPQVCNSWGGKNWYPGVRNQPQEQPII